jgi:hypothetical protein
VQCLLIRDKIGSVNHNLYPTYILKLERQEEFGVNQVGQVIQLPDLCAQSCPGVPSRRSQAQEEHFVQLCHLR